MFEIKLINDNISSINNLLKAEKTIIECANVEQVRAFYSSNPNMQNAEGELAILHDQYLHELGKVFSKWVEKVFPKGGDSLIPIGLSLMHFFTNDDGDGPHLIDAFEDEGTIITYSVLRPNSSILAVGWKKDEIILHTAGYTENVKFGPTNDIYVDDFRETLGENWATALAPILKPWLIKGESCDDLPELPEGKTLETLTGEDIRKMIEDPICDMIASLDDSPNPEPTPPSPQVCDYNAEAGCDLCVYQMPDGRCWKNRN